MSALGIDIFLVPLLVVGIRSLLNSPDEKQTTPGNSNVRASAEERADKTRINRLNALKARQEEALNQRISMLEDRAVRTELSANLTSVKSQLARDSEGIRWNDVSQVESCYLDLKAKITQAELDAQQEEFLQSRIADLTQELESSGLLQKLPGFVPMYEEIRKEIDSVGADTTKQAERINILSKMEHRLTTFVAEARSAGEISLEGMYEEKTPVAFHSIPRSSTGENRLAKFRDDIETSFAKIRYLDEPTAESLAHFYEESQDCTLEARLDAIRTKLRLTHAQLKEQATLTEVFRADLEPYLPVLRGIPATRILATELGQALGEKVITRDVYNRFYVDIRTAIEKASVENIATEILDTAQGVLSSLGYRLLEDDAATSLASGETRYFETPQDDYRVAVNIAENGSMMTRLVRVVGDESEKQRQSVYQKQKDTEAAQKWCNVRQKIEDEMVVRGFQVQTKLRVEPEDEGWELPVFVDSRKRKTKTARRRKDVLSERSAG